jgi:hypothetical protein
MEPAMRSTLHAARLLVPLAAALFGGVGCAAFSNPTTHPSVPVRRLPEEVFGKPREEQLDIPQALLRQRPPDSYKLDAGDTLGIFLEGVIGSANQPLPVQFPGINSPTQHIGVGFPFPVYDDGTIGLPLIPPVKVRGLTVAEARQLIFNTYRDSGVLEERNIKLQVSLYRPRLYRVLVVRQDAGGAVIDRGGFINSRRGAGFVLDLPAYENDVLTALTRSGGLPGIDARNEVLLQRGVPEEAVTAMPVGPIPGLDTVRIPLRLRPGETVPFRPEDIVLRNGDILFIQSRDTEVYYTAGLIPPSERPIPRDYDLDVLEAVMQAVGPVANGGIFNSNLSGSIISQGIGGPSPSQLTVLRKAPGNRQITIRVDLNRAMQDPRERILVQPGDVLVLQETLGEALTRYLSTNIRQNFVGFFLRQNDAVGTTTIKFP